MQREDDKSIGWLYCLQTREFINNREPVFKIGKTGKGDFSRFKQYPKGSELLCYSKVYKYENQWACACKYIARYKLVDLVPLFKV